MLYFLPLAGTYKDGLPLDKILDPDVRSLVEVISHFLEISHGGRSKQIHGHIFYPIFKWLTQKAPMNWAIMVQEEIMKGLKSTKTLITFGPQLTKVI